MIKRYASRRLYNTETSDYVTLEDIAGFIRDGREEQIVDLKSGDDLTRRCNEIDWTFCIQTTIRVSEISELLSWTEQDFPNVNR